MFFKRADIIYEQDLFLDPRTIFLKNWTHYPEAFCELMSLAKRLEMKSTRPCLTKGWLLTSVNGPFGAL